MATTQTNQQYSLNLRDLLRGLLITVLTAALTAISEMLRHGFDAIEWKEVGVLSLSAGIAYLLKNYFTPTEIVIRNAPQNAVSAVKEGADVKVGATTIPSTPAT